MTVLAILKDSYLNDLEAAIATASGLERYRSSHGFELDAARLFRETSLELRCPLPDLCVGPASTPQARAESDCANAVALHVSMPTMDPTVATDRRLWAGLTHGRYFEYTRKRWPIPRGDDRARDHVREHWFYKRGLRRNGVARLWWAAEMTFAPWTKDGDLAEFEKPDEYHYTGLMLRHQDIWQGIIERDFGHNLRVRICVLEALDATLSSAPNLTVLATRFTKDVNLMGTHTDFAALDVPTLRTRLADLALRCCESES